MDYAIYIYNKFKSENFEICDFMFWIYRFLFSNVFWIFGVFCIFVYFIDFVYFVYFRVTPAKWSLNAWAMIVVEPELWNEPVPASLSPKGIVNDACVWVWRRGAAGGRPSYPVARKSFAAATRVKGPTRVRVYI